MFVSVLLVEQGDEIIRVSFRSKPPLAESDPDIDVATIAQSFSGGGHYRAAGARIEGDLPDVRSKVVESLTETLVHVNDSR